MSAAVLPHSILPLGDSAAYVEFSQTLDASVNDVVQALAIVVRERRVRWLVDVIPTLGGLALHFDVDSPDLPDSPLDATRELVSECMATADPALLDPGPLIELPVCYDTLFALDLDEVAQRVSLSPAEVVRRHSEAEYRVLMMGFVPGSPYLGGLDPRLSVPRKTSPRPSVPAGSIAIANLQSVVYPFATPGGWSILGRTPLLLFDPQREPACLFTPRARVRFRPIDADEYAALARRGAA